MSPEDGAVFATRLPATAGIILAGGLARRMGGKDKPLQPVSGRPILQWLIDALAPQCTCLLLNANGDPARFAGFGLPVIADDVDGRLGPLAGIVAGLDTIAREHPACRWALTIPGDTPFPPIDLVARLHAERESAGAQIAVAASGQRMHPAIGLWPVAVSRAMRGFLVEEGQRRVRAFVERYAFVVVDWPTDDGDPFLNVNTPGDLALAEALARRQEAAGLRPSVSANGM